MRIRHCLTACVLATLIASPALAENTITVESRDACVNQDSVTIGIYITNDVQVRHLVLPIEVRAGEGLASVKSVEMGWGGRLPTERGQALADNIFNHLYLAKDCECPPSGAGYGTLKSTESGPHEIKMVPFGMLLSRLRFTGKDLVPGTDSTEASIHLTLDVGSKPGEIIIDTTCVCPNHHLTFVHGQQNIQATRPEFTKGVITVGKCEDKEE